VHFSHPMPVNGLLDAFRPPVFAIAVPMEAPTTSQMRSNAVQDDSGGCSIFAESDSFESLGAIGESFVFKLWQSRTDRPGEHITADARVAETRFESVVETIRRVEQGPKPSGGLLGARCETCPTSVFLSGTPMGEGDS
jgi:hypothetical protein